MREQFWMSETVRASLVYGKTVSFLCLFYVTVGAKGRNQGSAGLKGLFQTFDIIGLPVVEAVKGTDVKDYFFLRNFISGFIGNADRLNKPQIFFTVILNRFDKHNTLRKIPSYLPIYYII